MANQNYDPGPDEGGAVVNYDTNPPVSDKDNPPSTEEQRNTENWDSTGIVGKDKIDSKITDSIGIGSIIYPDVQTEFFNRMDNRQRDSIEGTATRTTWVRMSSGQVPLEEYIGPAGKKNTRQLYNDIDGAIVLMGGTLDTNGNLKAGWESQYLRSNFNFGQLQTDSDGNLNTQVGPAGEKFVPMAGITDVDMSTEGELGALRKASVNWQCWSLEQLEFYEKFFMKLGATILLEFGWSTGKQDDIVLYDVSTNDATTKSIQDALKNGKKKSLQSGGKYECLSGLISNFNWTANDAGGFDCTTEIMTHGEAMVGAKTNDSPFGMNELSEEQKQALGDSLEELEQATVNNLQKHLGNIDDELYALIKEDEVDDTEVDNITRLVWPGKGNQTDVIDVRGMDYGFDKNSVFVTWGWMEDNILSKYLGRASKDYRIKYTIRSIEYNGSEYESVRVSNHPIFAYEAGKVSATTATIPDNNEAYEPFNFKPFLDRDDDPYSGNLRNILVNSRTIKRAFSDVNNFAEGMEKLFAEINYAFYGMFDFKIQVDPDNPTNMKVIDVNYFKKDPYQLLANPSTPDNPNSVFVFPAMMSKNNIVKAQEMESKIPSEGMYAALGGQNKASASPDSGDQKTSVAAKIQQDIDDGLFDPLMFGINIPDIFDDSNKFGNLTANPNEELDAGKGPPITVNAKTDLDEGWKTSNTSEDAENPNTSDEENKVDKSTTKEEYKANRTWSEWAADKWEGFTNAVASPFTSISTSELVPTWEVSFWSKKLQVGSETNPVGTLQEPVMIPLEVSFDIDGIAGVFPGNYVHTSYIPMKYQNRVILMVKGVDHKLTNGGWDTKLETIMVGAFSRTKQNPNGAETNQGEPPPPPPPPPVQNKHDDLINDDGTTNREYYTSEGGHIGEKYHKDQYFVEGEKYDKQGNVIETDNPHFKPSVGNNPNRK
tara:strand:- start:856 stop:3669 length:2814 start_codon:yes stop_codon:yes gene_type:complete